MAFRWNSLRECRVGVVDGVRLAFGGINQILLGHLFAGASWGTGNLHYQVRVYPLKVKSGIAGGIGYRSVKGTAKVHERNNLEDFAGIYTGGTAGVIVGTKGAGASTLDNSNGVASRPACRQVT